MLAAARCLKLTLDRIMKALTGAQSKHAREAAAALRELVAQEGCALCVTHGNGPQIGQLALQVGKPSAITFYSAACIHLRVQTVGR